MKRIFLLLLTLLVLIASTGCGRSVSNSNAAVVPPFTLPEATEAHKEYASVLEPLFFSEMLFRNWSAEDISAFIPTSPEAAPAILVAYATILGEAPLAALQQEHPEGIPAALVEQTLTEFFVFTPQQIQALSAASYDQEKAVYHIPQNIPQPDLIWAITAVHELDDRIEVEYALFSEPIANTTPIAYRASTPATLTMQLNPEGFILFSSVQLGEQQLAS